MTASREGSPEPAVEPAQIEAMMRSANGGNGNRSSPGIVKEIYGHR